MAKTYFKATRVDGTDFYGGTVDYAAALTNGGRVRATTPPQDSYACCTGSVLHAADTPSETLIGGSWPCRLFEVTGRPVAQEGHKFGFRSLAVVREVEAHQALGPMGPDLILLFERIRHMTREQGDAAWDAAWDVARDAAWDVARDAARDAAWDVARDAARAAAWDAARAVARAAAWDAARAAAWDAARAVARAAAWDAARALTVRDLIGDGFTQEYYDLLTRPLRTAGVVVHPGDGPLP